MAQSLKRVGASNMAAAKFTHTSVTKTAIGMLDDMLFSIADRVSIANCQTPKSWL